MFALQVNVPIHNIRVRLRRTPAFGPFARSFHSQAGPTAGTLPLQIATTGQQGEGQRGYERGGQSNRTSFAQAWAEDSRSLPSSVRSSDCQKKTVSSRVIIRQASSDKRLVTLRLFAERAAGLGRAPERSGGARPGPAGAWSTFTYVCMYGARC